MKNAKIQKFKCDILSHFQTLCHCGNKIITQMCGLLFLGSVSISETAKELNDVYAKTLLTVVSQKAKHAE